MPIPLCHASSDGECNYDKCPQKVKYENACKFWLKDIENGLYLGS